MALPAKLTAPVWQLVPRPAAAGLWQSSVSRMWRVLRLKPHLVEPWNLGSTDSDFIAKVRHVSSLAATAPPDHRVAGVWWPPVNSGPTGMARSAQTGPLRLPQTAAPRRNRPAPSPAQAGDESRTRPVWRSSCVPRGLPGMAPRLGPQANGNERARTPPLQETVLEQFLIS